MGDSGSNAVENADKGGDAVSSMKPSTSASSASSGSMGVDPLDVLSDSSDVAQWMNEGLPADRISIENGCIITSCQRWPLLVDPQLQGIIWLRARDFRHKKAEGAEDRDEQESAGQALVILQPAQKNWTITLKTAITSGQSVILENLGESIDASLEPVIMRQIYKKGRSWFLQFAAEEIEVDPRFRLYLHTKLPNPHYRPEILAYCTLIDFSVTEKGLEDQLLANVVNLEQPDLETQKRQLQQEFNGYQIQLLQLENDLLERLSNAPDDILSDVPLIEGLEKTKLTAIDVGIALRKGKDAEREINLAREVYRPVANEASMMYFLMSQLCKVNHMYRYSLESYMTFFFVALDGVAPPATTSDDTHSGGATAHDRVGILKEALRWTIFSMVTRGLYEEHKLLFLTQLVFLLFRRGIIGANSGYEPQFARFLLQGSKIVGPENAISWLNESQWQSLQALITLAPFERFVSDLEESEPRFREWYNSTSPELEKLPLDWRELDKSAPFLKLLVVKCLRPDRLTQAVSNFIVQTLPSGSQFLNCDSQLNSFAILQSAFKESSPWTPMYFILSPGSDVVADVDKLAVQDQERIKGVDYHNIALGQGQEQVAMKTLHMSVENGHWVILNNVHLMPKWMLELDKWLEQLAKASKTASYATLRSNLSSSNKDITRMGTSRSLSLLPPSAATTGSGGIGPLHPNFRLFITSDPSTNIPIGVLERSIKLTNEPPTGLRANVKRAFCCFPKNIVDELEPRTRCILFALCYFHSLMLERKKFGPQGFNMLYPFAASDLLASSTVLRNYMDNAPARVPWPDLRYLFGEIMYGGHIVNELDRLVAATYLQYFLRDELLEELSMLPYGDDASGGSGGGGNSGQDGGSSGGGGGDGGDGPSGGQQRREFLAPKLSAGFDRILEHVNTSLLNETPTAFGLHPNAEVAFRTENGQILLQSMLLLTTKEEDVQGDNSDDEEEGTGGSGAKETGDAVQLAAEGVLQDVLENYRDFRFDIQELFFKGSSDSGSRDGSSRRGKGGRLFSSVATPDADDMDPFQTVLLQECQHMNHLLETMTDSLAELELAFRGDVPLTEAMEKLQTFLYYERVPDNWLAAACPSRRSLAPWLANLQQRIAQLQEWIGSAPELPLVLWLPGLFNPQAFLTAVLQTAARKHNVELDSLRITAEVTKRTIDTVDAPARDGQFIHGLYLEGARWDFGNGVLESSLPREMYVSMPVLTCRAIVNTANKDQSGGSGSGGGGKAGASNVFECPVYRTQQRGPTLIFMSPLRSKVPPAKWVLAGVAMLMEVV
ncbi:Dynein heavy chain 17, axonemal [Phytophthora cactorum]|nr:Dynein heavy chain 17, axonemal [Phytophthora cactorum]